MKKTDNGSLPSLYGCWIKPIGTNHYYSQPWEYGADLQGEVTTRKDEYDSNAEQKYYLYWNMVLNGR